MKSVLWQRIIFIAGMLGIAGPSLVEAVGPYKYAKLAVQIVCGLALAFVVQAKGQQPPKQDGQL